MENMSRHCFQKSGIQIVVMFMYAKFLKIASRTQKTEKVCL